MGAVLLRSPAFVITEEEAKLLADSITRVTELYDVPLMDEKSRAWLNLGMASVEVYGTRIAAIVMESKRKPQIIRPFDRDKPDQGGGVVLGAQPTADGVSHANQA
jgi:hypothetical protein